MVNLARVSNASSLGRVLRLPLRLIPNTLTVPILQGPLRGMRWVAGSSIHGCWLGCYESVKQRQIADAVSPGMVCFDIGANAGIYTLLFSTLTGPKGRVVAFEPLPQNCVFVQRHVDLNACTNVLVQQLAVADFDGVATFDPTDSSSQGRLSDKGRLNVTCARIDSLIAVEKIPIPQLIKIDVEGAEVAVLEGASETLARNKPTIFLATHGLSQHEQCLRLLDRLGYAIAPIGGGTPDDTDEIVARAR